MDEVRCISFDSSTLCMHHDASMRWERNAMKGRTLTGSPQYMYRLTGSFALARWSMATTAGISTAFAIDVSNNTFFDELSASDTMLPKLRRNIPYLTGLISIALEGTKCNASEGKSESTFAIVMKAVK